MATIEEEIYEDFDQSAEEIAKSKNCHVFYPEDNQLTVDIDSDQQYRYFLKRFDELGNLLPEYIEMEEMPSKSGLPHRHIVITCGREWTEAERIAIQFALASDPVRETLNLWRWLHGVERPTRFFQPNEAK